MSLNLDNPEHTDETVLKDGTILIVEDEPSLVFTLTDTLENEGFIVHVVTEGNQAMDSVVRVQPDLILLDLMLPGKSGYDICREIREMEINIPIIMLTARNQEIDKVTGLTIGADDYITKPFGVKELLARINARLRRVNHYERRPEPVHSFTLPPFRILLQESRVVKPDGSDITLTAREVELMRHLYKWANQPVSRDQLLEKVWRYEHSTNTRTVDVHISKLRAKIEDRPEEPKYLITLHGVGYMLKTETADAPTPDDPS